MGRNQNDTIVCVVFGKLSKVEFMPASDVEAWKQTLDPKERGSVLVIGTDLTPDQEDYINRTRTIIDRHEREIDEAADRVKDYLKSRKKTA
jgi:hypothetical protein